MKKINKILSTMFALLMTATPLTQVALADGNEPATVLPESEKVLHYHYKGMGTRWVNACKEGKPAARFFWYNGPGSGWSKGAQSYIGKWRQPQYQSVLILLDNEAAHTALTNYYKQKNLPKQVAILKSHPSENLFLICYEDLLEISKTITLFTYFGEGMDDHWATEICLQSKLSANVTIEGRSDADEIMKGFEEYPLQLKAQRDLRQVSTYLGGANFAWDCGQCYLPYGCKITFPE